MLACALSLNCELRQLSSPFTWSIHTCGLACPARCRGRVVAGDPKWGTCYCDTGAGNAGKQIKCVCVYVLCLADACIRACVSMVCFYACFAVAIWLFRAWRLSVITKLRWVHSLLWICGISHLHTVIGRVSPRQRKRESRLYISCCTSLRGRTQRAVHRRSSLHIHLLYSQRRPTARAYRQFIVV